MTRPRRSVRFGVIAARRGRVRAMLVSALLVCGVLAAAAGDPGAAAAGDSFALRARLVYPVTPEEPGPIADGMVIVRDGRIEAVGADLPVPDDLPLIVLPDAVVCPGFVSAGGALAGRHAGDETVSGAYRAADTFDTYADYRMTLARGTTTVHLSPGTHRLVSGMGAVARLGGPHDARLLKPAADLTFTLGVFNPPLLVRPPFYPSSDVPIEPAEIQRPGSRLGQFLELERRVAAVAAWQADPLAHRFERLDVHQRAFGEAWVARLPLRIEVQRAEDIEQALAFVQRHDRRAYLVGLAEADCLAELLRQAALPVVVRIAQDYRQPAPDLGPHPDVLEPHLTTAAELGVPLALAGQADDPEEDLRVAAMLAVRGGLAESAALAAITRVPAEILGVGDRVGSLAPGRDADLLVLSGKPLDINTWVRRAYVGGRPVFEAPANQALVVRGGTVWVGDGQVIRDGAVLIEDGRVQAVGHRVPHPPFARIIDAGPESFLTPGFIDAYGHLGLQGDQSRVGSDVPLHKTLAVAGPEFARVARAGVTTVLLAPYRGDNGARLAAIKTAGDGREALVARPLAGVFFSFLGGDPLTDIRRLREALEAGKKYVEQWKKYDEELEKWKQGAAKPADKAVAEEQTDEPQVDPITGTWEATLRGDPLPEAVTLTIRLKLTGNTIEGRASDPGGGGEETTLNGTLEGNEVELEIDQETPVGKPKIKATLDREDHMAGSVEIAQFKIEFEATRTDRGPVEFKITRKRQKTKDGRPAPPKVDERLEPYRPLLAGTVPAVVAVQTAAQIDAVLKLFVEEYKLPLVLLNADEAADVAGRLEQHKDRLGVIAPPDITRRRERRPYAPLADLSRRGLAVALQSNAEDGARSLPLMGLYAVRAGLGGDAALRALTIDAARMYKLDDRVGTLLPERDGDVLIFSGHPFDAGSRLERVIIRGQEVAHE